jgi:hypothetical protein
MENWWAAEQALNTFFISLACIIAKRACSYYNIHNLMSSLLMLQVSLYNYIPDKDDAMERQILAEQVQSVLWLTRLAW